MNNLARGEVIFLSGRWQGSELFSEDPNCGDPRLSLVAAGYAVSSVGLAPSLIQDPEVAAFGLHDAINSILIAIETISERFERPLAVLGYSFGAALTCVIPWADHSSLRPNSAILLDGGLPSSVSVSEPFGMWDENPCWKLNFREHAIRRINEVPGRLDGIIPQNKFILQFLISGVARWPMRLSRELSETGAINTGLPKYDLPTLGIISAREQSNSNRISRTLEKSSCPLLEIVRIDKASHADIMAGPVAREYVSPEVLKWLNGQIA